MTTVPRANGHTWPCRGFYTAAHDPLSGGFTCTCNVVAGDADHPPSRDDLTDAEAWVYQGDYTWKRVTIPADVDGNAGGSPAPVEDDLGGHP